VTISAAERAKYPPPALSPRTQRRFHPDAIIGIGGPPRQALLGGPPAGLNNAKDALYVGYAGLSTFDRTLVDIRATRDQWDARPARPDNCTFSVGKNKQRGVADHQPNVPAGGVYMRHFRTLP